MDTLTLVRHGDYHSRRGDQPWQRHLTEKGRQQMRHVASSIDDVVDRIDTAIISSPAPRALDSAAIIARRLGIENYEVYDALLCQGNRMPAGRNAEIRAIVDGYNGRTDHLVVAGHYAVAQHFPRYFAAKEGWPETPRIPEIEKGQAVHLDLKARCWQILPEARYVGRG